MTDYGRIFGEEVALGLGLGSSSEPTTEELIAEYEADPADAFTKAAARFCPGDAIPVPFANVVQK